MSGYVPEEPLRLPPGVAEMLADPAHYKRWPAEMVNYEPEPQPEGRWARLRARLKRKARR
jgi:hypothetical protein